MKRILALILILASLSILSGCGSMLGKNTSIPEDRLEAESIEETLNPIILIQAPTDPPEPEPSLSEPVEIISEYRIFVENVSWTDAKSRCEEEGGHLVVINDSDEFNKVVDLASDMGISVIWIGLHRELEMLVWETDDLNAAFYYDWDKGEPSEMDGDTPEDYVFIWNWTGRGWVYNDCINDPAGEYPESYRDQIGFVCEIEKPKT